MKLIGSLATIGLIGLAVSACSFEAEMTNCRNWGGDKRFANVVSRKLTALGVRHSIEDDGQLCFASESTDKVNDIASDVGRFYRSVSTLLCGGEREQAIRAWISKNSIPHEVFESGNKQHIVLYSESEEDAKARQVELRRLEAASKCVCAEC